jgi:hypothetical protein
MSKLKQGVLCEVVGGVLYPSPNLGKIVETVAVQGEHALHGTIWRCKGHGKDLVSEWGVVAIAMDFAEDWLKPLPDQQLNQGILSKENLVA